MRLYERERERRGRDRERGLERDERERDDRQTDGYKDSRAKRRILERDVEIREYAERERQTDQTD